MTNTEDYGYGFMINNIPYGTEITHGGNTISFTSVISRYIDKNVTIIILVNNALYDVNILKNTLADIVFGNKYEIPKAPEVVQINKSVYNDYSGIYKFDIGSSAKITTDGDHLYLTIQDQSQLEILPEADNKFFCRRVDAEGSFTFNNNNKVIGFTLHQAGVDYKAVKQDDTSVNLAPAPIVVEQSILNTYMGNYELGKGAILTITSESGHLYAQLTGQDKYEIYAETTTKFNYKIVIASIDFNKNADGKVISLTLKQNGKELMADKTN